MAEISLRRLGWQFNIFTILVAAEMAAKVSLKVG